MAEDSLAVEDSTEAAGIPVEVGASRQAIPSLEGRAFREKAERSFFLRLIARQARFVFAGLLQVGFGFRSGRETGVAVLGKRQDLPEVFPRFGIVAGCCGRLRCWRRRP